MFGGIEVEDQIVMVMDGLTVVFLVCVSSSKRSVLLCRCYLA